MGGCVFRRLRHARSSAAAAEPPPSERAACPTSEHVHTGTQAHARMHLSKHDFLLAQQGQRAKGARKVVVVDVRRDAVALRAWRPRGRRQGRQGRQSRGAAAASPRCCTLAAATRQPARQPWPHTSRTAHRLINVHDGRVGLAPLRQHAPAAQAAAQRAQHGRHRLHYLLRHDAWQGRGGRAGRAEG